MVPAPDRPQSAESLRDAYQSARGDAEAAHEAVGDAEDALAHAERVLAEHEPADGDQQRAARQARVDAAEEAWHDRRHDAYAASQARDHARQRADGAAPEQ